MSRVWKIWREAISRWKGETDSHDRRWYRGRWAAIRSHISGGVRRDAGSFENRIYRTTETFGRFRMKTYCDARKMVLSLPVSGIEL